MYWDEVKTCAGAPGAFGEGGVAYAFGRSNLVVMMHYNNIYHSSQGGKNLTHYVRSGCAKPTRPTGGVNSFEEVSEVFFRPTCSYPWLRALRGSFPLLRCCRRVPRPT